MSLGRRQRLYNLKTQRAWLASRGVLLVAVVVGVVVVVGDGSYSGDGRCNGGDAAAIVSR